jgi:tetratricopeptide (TPR) repeat protein
LRGGVSLAALLLGTGGHAFALDSTEAKGRAELAVRAVEADAAKGIGGIPVRVQPITPAQRVAAGDMLLRNRDYERAIDTLNKVVELARQGKMPETALADGSFLLGEAYFQSNQYLSARRHYREILDRSSSARFAAYTGRALSRLVDVALRTDDLESLDYVFARLNSLPASDPSGSLAYARAKALFARGDFPAAKAAVNTVPAGSEFTLQAQYLLGVILTKEAGGAPAPTPAPAPGTAPATTAPVAAPTPPPLGIGRFGPAVEQFRRVTRIPASSPGQRHIVDLAWMAIGRLHYETEGFLEAAEAYSHVDRKSPEFSTMLHELAWVYVRLGEYQRAQRALEVLTITDPNNLDIADGSLLRADLMLRSGQFDKALTLYRSVRGRFDPIRDQVDRFITATTDPAAYYDRLTADPDLPTDNQLPQLALSWAREAAEDENVFAVIDDANRSRDLIKKTRRLAARLSAVLAVPTRAKAFPEIRASLERTLGMSNKLARARGTLAEGLDDVADDVSGELASVRAERRKLMRRLGFLPVTTAEFASRDESGERQWNKVSQSLQQLTIEADKLAAIVNGLKRVLNEGKSFGITPDENSRERFRLEIEANERDLAAYHKRIQQYRDAIDMGRVQSGFGDQRYIDDEAARRRFRELLTREVELCAAGQDSGDAAEYARAVRPILSRADAVDMRLEGMKTDLERNALAGAEKLKVVIVEEMSNVEGQAANLEELDQEARLVVGEVAMRNFAAVRDRLKSIVLRSDIGIVQEAWEQREEQRQRVRNLQRERAREEQLLNDELREVLEDAEEDR